MDKTSPNFIVDRTSRFNRLFENEYLTTTQKNVTIKHTDGMMIRMNNTKICTTIFVPRLKFSTPHTIADIRFGITVPKVKKGTDTDTDKIQMNEIGHTTDILLFVFE